MNPEAKNVDMTEMEEFLRSRGISNDQLVKIKEQKIEPEIIVIMDDVQLAQFIPKYGDRIALRQFCKLKSGVDCTHSERKQSLLEKLRNKLKTKQDFTENAEFSQKLKKHRGGNLQDNKQIEIGWLCCMTGEDKYRQVRENSGGGTRKIKVPKSVQKEYIIEKGIHFFFPNGKSTKGNLNEFTIDLLDFKNHKIEDNVSVAEMLEITGLCKLRFYLATKKKEPKEIDDDCDRLLVSCQDYQDVARTDNETVNSVHTENDFTTQVTNPEKLDDNEGSPFLSQFSSRDCAVNNTLDNYEVNLLLDSVFDAPSCDNLPMNDLDIPSQFLTENLEQQLHAKSLTDILSNLQQKIDLENINKFNIFRNDVFKCCIRAMRRKTFNPFYKISVKFSDCEGITEGAIDEGGPTREVFRLVLKSIENSQLFTGAKKKHVSLHNNSITDRLYYEAGRIMALSLVHGGPGPHFFSETLFSLLVCGMEGAMPTLDDVDIIIRDKLTALTNATELHELQDIILSEDIFSIAGCSHIKHVDEKWKIINEMLYFYGVKRIGEPLQQLKEGLQTCDIYEQIRMHPDLFRSLFCDNKIILTADAFEEMFHIQYHEVGSNKRELENRAISYFRDYILDCEENSMQSGNDKSKKENDATIVTLTDILVFATGADVVPPLGFPIKPIILFLHEECKSKFPLSNTCALQLKLPTIHVTYEDFKSNMDFGIGNAKSFGFA